jgi:hypothetical protein
VEEGEATTIVEVATTMVEVVTAEEVVATVATVEVGVGIKLYQSITHGHSTLGTFLAILLGWSVDYSRRQHLRRPGDV